MILMLPVPVSCCRKPTVKPQLAFNPRWCQHTLTSVFDVRLGSCYLSINRNDLLSLRFGYWSVLIYDLVWKLTHRSKQKWFRQKRAEQMEVLYNPLNANRSLSLWWSFLLLQIWMWCGLICSCSKFVVFQTRRFLQLC